MLTSLSPSIELPSDYTAIERIGAGGYGEVWKATAPGGVEKAVKIVFGHCDEDLAERELKSLERMKSVRHPFILSIERFVVVNGRLMIVTELADMSLSDCFESYRADGQSGIPREQLLRYLWDAAEALDYLVDRHTLQHLDIKPENLLVVGDHVKVADFGLVKELTTRTLNSMMGGMTPIYSAPEIYDDNPSPRSDQYSLAIVYQQMLTGALPFAGRTPAQLAKQHTQAEPNLQSLCRPEQVVVRRALEKCPAARFSTCCEFVHALQTLDTKAGKYRPAAPDQASPQQGSTEKDDTKSAATLDTDHVKSVVATNALHSGPAPAKPGSEPLPRKPPERTRPFPKVSPEIRDVETPALDTATDAPLAPTLFVGIGGIGVTMLMRTRQRIGELDGPALDQPGLSWLAIDVDRDALTSSSRTNSGFALPVDDLLHTPLRRPKQYRDASQDLLKWVSRRWLYNIPRSLQTRGYRPLGRIALVDHAHEVMRRLQARIRKLAGDRQDREKQPSEVRVVLLAGMSGGTGSGTVIDLAQAVRSICQELDLPVNVLGVLGCTFHPESTDSLAAANMFSLLTELNHAQRSGNCGGSTPPGVAARYELSRHPFDEVCTVSVPPRTERTDRELALGSVANYFALSATSETRSLLDAGRRNNESPNGTPLTFHTLGCIRPQQLSAWIAEQQSARLINSLQQYWLAPSGEARIPNSHFFGHHADSRFVAAVLAQMPPPPAISPPPDSSDSLDEQAVEAANQDAKKARAAEIRRLADRLMPILDAYGPYETGAESSPTEEAILATASEQVVAELYQMLRHNGQPSEDLGQEIASLATAKLTSLASQADGSEEVQLARVVLDQTDSRPLDCGFRRRTMLMLPSEGDSTAVAKALADQRPTTCQVAADVAEPYLVSTGSGVRPLDLAARLAELHPDIDDAAGRLHARNDIAWRDLREP